MPKKVLIALPPKMLEETDNIAETEHRTRSDLIREAIRQYIARFNQQQAALRQQQIRPFPPIANPYAPSPVVSRPLEDE